MIEVLTEVERKLEKLVADLDPSVLETPAAAARLVERFARLERLAAAGRTLVARRAEESMIWAREGHKTAAQWMAATAGEPVGAAQAMLDTSTRLDSLPETGAALRAGRLSTQQVNQVAGAATVSPGSERRLLEVAERDTLHGLKRAAQQVKAAAVKDEQARYDKIRADRSLRSWTDDDGAGCVMLRATPDACARFLAGVDAFRDQIFDRARQEGRRESWEAYGADAAVLMAEHATSAPAGQAKAPKATVHVRVDLDALRRGHTVDGEVCEIGGIPFPVAVARELLDDAALSMLLIDGTDVQKVISWTRHIPEPLRLSIVERDQTCVVHTCSRTTGLQIDHEVDFARGGPTSYDNLRRLCDWHHHLKTNKGYRFTRSAAGDVDLSPPERDDTG